MKSRFLTILSTIFVVIAARAEKPSVEDTTIVRPVTSAYMLKVGSAHRADTYLSPIRYTGWQAGFGYERFQTMKFDPSNWVMALNMDISIDGTQNRVGNATMWGVELSGRWAMMRRITLTPRFTIGAGGATSLRLGALYLQRNGNNPVAANCSWTVDAAAYATYKFTLGRVPVVAMYRAELPLVGAFFAPEYGQLYYEIYMGERHGIVHAAYPGRYFALDQRLSVDLRLGATSLRLGYSLDTRSTKVNDLVTHCVTHTAIIGIAGEWMSLAPSRSIDNSARIISAIY